VLESKRGPVNTAEIDEADRVTPEKAVAAMTFQDTRKAADVRKKSNSHDSSYAIIPRLWFADCNFR